MSETDSYDTIDSRAHSEIKIKGSRFITDAAPIASANEADQFLKSIIRTYPDATHHCYAYRTFDGLHVLERASDAGEPAGSAGPPILQVLAGRQLINLIVVVTRYFGGTKLGIGGLIRAYTEATQTVLDMASIKRRIRTESVQIEFPYELTGAVMHVISQFQGQIIESIYTENTSLILNVPYRHIDLFHKSLIEATANRISFHLWKSS